MKNRKVDFLALYEDAVSHAYYSEIQQILHK